MEAIPTQAKLLLLAASVWDRSSSQKPTRDNLVQKSNASVLVVGASQPALVPIAELLAQLTPSNLRLDSRKA